MRKHFNPQRICSSDNYELSRRVHIKDRWDIQAEELRKVNKSLKEHSKLEAKCYIKFFEDIQYIKEEEVAEYEAHGVKVYHETF